MRFFLAGLVLMVAAAGLHAQNVVVNLLAPVEAATPGGEVRVDLVILNPTPTEVIFETPLTLSGTLSSERRSWPVELRGQAGGGAQIAARGFSYRSFIFTVPAEARGRLVLDLAHPQPVRALIEVKAAAGPGRQPHIVSAPLSNILPGQPAESASRRSRPSSGPSPGGSARTSRCISSTDPRRPGPSSSSVSNTGCWARRRGWVTGCPPCADFTRGSRSARCGTLTPTPAPSLTRATCRS